MSAYDEIPQDTTATTGCCPCEPAVEVEPAPVVDEIAPVPVEECTPAPVEDYTSAPVEQIAPGPAEPVAPAPAENYTTPVVEASAPAPVEQDTTPVETSAPAYNVAESVAQPQSGPVDLIDAIKSQNGSAAHGQSLVISEAPVDGTGFGAPRPSGAVDLADLLAPQAQNSGGPTPLVISNAPITAPEPALADLAPALFPMNPDGSRYLSTQVVARSYDPLGVPAPGHSGQDTWSLGEGWHYTR